MCQQQYPHDNQSFCICCFYVAILELHWMVNFALQNLFHFQEIFDTEQANNSEIFTN